MCRLFRTNVENVVHVISGYPNMSARYYLLLRYDALAKYVLKAIIKKNYPDHRYHESRELEYVKNRRYQILVEPANKNRLEGSSQ